MATPIRWLKMAIFLPNLHRTSRNWVCTCVTLL